MMKLSANLVLFLFPFLSFCIPSYDNLKLIPSKPQPGDSVQIEYTPISSYLLTGVRGFIFLNRPNENWARAIEVPMARKKNTLVAIFPTSPQDVSLLIVFIDSMGNTIDNNSESGYWSPMYKNDEVIPGGLASIANMYFGIALANLYKIKPARDVARELYQEDFKKKPDLKRFYWRKYITSIRYEKEPTLFLSELNQYSDLSDLTEWELLDLSKIFDSTGDTLNSKRFDRLVYQRYPLGEWSMQATSMKYQKKFIESQSAEERMAVEKEHRARFVKWPKVEGGVRYLEAYEAIFFLKRIEEYIQLNKYNEWKCLVDSIRPDAKYMAYYLASKRLNEKKIFLIHAEELAKEASEWREESLNGARISTEWPFISDREVRFNREKELANWLEVYATTLRQQGKNEEARSISEKAQLYAAHQAAKLKNRPTAKLITEPLPTISLFNSERTPVDLSIYEGKTIVLDFWASWCAPCIAGFEKMSELKKKFSNENVVFLFVNTQEKGTEVETHKRAKEILQKQRYDFRVLFDPQNKSSSRFDFNALPTVVVIDKEGIIRFKYTGSSDEGVLHEVISKLSSGK